MMRKNKNNLNKKNMLTTELVKENIEYFKSIFGDAHNNEDATMQWILDIPRTKHHPKGIAFIASNLDEKNCQPNELFCDSFPNQLFIVFLEGRGFIALEYDGNYDDNLKCYIPLEKLELKWSIIENYSGAVIYQNYSEIEEIKSVEATYKDGLFEYHNGREMIQSKNAPENVPIYSYKGKPIFDFNEFKNCVGHERLIYVPRDSKEVEFMVLRPDIVDIFTNKNDVSYIIEAENSDCDPFERDELKKIFKKLCSLIKNGPCTQEQLDDILMSASK
jgi:hypothetical protein